MNSPADRWIILATLAVAALVRAEPPPDGSATKPPTSDAPAAEKPASDKPGFVRQADLVDLVAKAESLTDEQVSEIRTKLEGEPDNLSLRAQLLAYYSRKGIKDPQARAAHREQVMWFVEKRPASDLAGSGQAHVFRQIDPTGFATIAEAWKVQAAAHASDARVQANAAAFFVRDEPQEAEQLLLRARELEPKNPEWTERLGRFYLRTMTKSGVTDAAIAGKALVAFEEAMDRMGDKDRFLILADVARAAARAGQLDKAREYAGELINTAGKNRQNWNYGNAMHHANLVLGEVALAKGDIAVAEEYLLKAARVPGTPQLAGAGPNMYLAAQLLRKDRTEAVVKYLELCRKFGRKERTDAWIEEIRAGKTPNFAASPGD